MAIGRRAVNPTMRRGVADQVDADQGFPPPLWPSGPRGSNSILLAGAIVAERLKELSELAIEHLPLGVCQLAPPPADRGQGVLAGRVTLEILILVAVIDLSHMVKVKKPRYPLHRLIRLAHQILIAEEESVVCRLFMKIEHPIADTPEVLQSLLTGHRPE